MNSVTVQAFECVRKLVHFNDFSVQIPCAVVKLQEKFEVYFFSWKILNVTIGSSLVRKIQHEREQEQKLHVWLAVHFDKTSLFAFVSDIR